MVIVVEVLYVYMITKKQVFAFLFLRRLRPQTGVPTIPECFSHSLLQLHNTTEDSRPRTASKNMSSVIVTSISSPSIVHCPPDFYDNLKLTKCYSPVAMELLDIERLETTALQ